MTPELIDIFESAPDLVLAKADKLLYQRFRNMEPQLVSCYEDWDGDLENEVLALYHKGRPLGMVSLEIRENLKKISPPKHYAHLDMVIVDKKYRQLGICHLLIVSSLLLVIKTWRQKLYSISCLAAHNTVEKFLKELSFADHPREGKDFWQGTLNLEENNLKELSDIYLKRAESCFLWTKYKLR